MQAKPVECGAALSTNCEINLSLLMREGTMPAEGSVASEPPSARVIERITFIFNNLSKSNVTEKANELKKLIAGFAEDFLRWLAYYIVTKRICVEHNQQPVYCAFLDVVDNPKLNNYVKVQTFRTIKILLRSSKTPSSPSVGERQLLKNLGLWLGAITIAKSIPIAAWDLDLKALLITAFHKGPDELLCAVPFVAKVLLSSATSLIFGVQSAWIRGVLRILVELYEQPGLALPLKFEISVLFKELGVEMRQLHREGQKSITATLADTHLDVQKPPSMAPFVKLEMYPNLEAQSFALRHRCQPLAFAPADFADTSFENSYGGIQSVSAPLASNPPAESGHRSMRNISTVDEIMANLKIPDSLHLFQLVPNLGHALYPAVRATIEELGPITQRTVTAAIKACDVVCRKDFALEPNAERVQKAAYEMVAALTWTLVAAWCDEPATSTLQSRLAVALGVACQQAQVVPEEGVIEQTACSIVTRNIHLLNSFVANYARLKAVSEVGQRFEGDVVLRKQAHALGRPYSDLLAARCTQRLPEALRLKSGALSDAQMRIYDCFWSTFCGYGAMVQEDAMAGDRFMNGCWTNATCEQSSLDEQCMSKVEVEELQVASLSQLVEHLDTVLHGVNVAQVKAAAACMGIRDALLLMLTCPSESLQLHFFLQTSTEHFLAAYVYSDHENRGDASALQQLSEKAELEARWCDNLSELFMSVCRSVAFQLTAGDLVRLVTQAVCMAPEDTQLNLRAVDFLLMRMLLQLDVYDRHLANLLRTTDTTEALSFARQLMLVNRNSENSIRKHVAQNLPLTAFVVHAMSESSVPRSGLPVAPQCSASLGVSRLPVTEPPQPVVRECTAVAKDVERLSTSKTLFGSSCTHDQILKVELLLRTWMQLNDSLLVKNDPERALAYIVHMMREYGMYTAEGLLMEFVGLCTEMVVDVVCRLLHSSGESQSMLVRHECYFVIDCFGKLICLLMRHIGGNDYQSKISFLRKVTNVIANLLHADHVVRGTQFIAMPYHRMLIRLFIELGDSDLQPIVTHITEIFGQVMFAVQPCRLPSFAFAWLAIIGHRGFVSRFLRDTSDVDRTAALYTQLIISQLRFLWPYLRNSDMPTPIRKLYEGTLRVFLLLLQVYPNVLCGYYFSLCENIPSNCIQLRNVILSAFPKNLRMPDPFSFSFERQADELLELRHEPKIHIDLDALLPSDLKALLERCLENPAIDRFKSEFLTKLLADPARKPDGRKESKYNAALMNTLVLYMGVRALRRISDRLQKVNMRVLANSSFAKFFEWLTANLCPEGRYIFLSAIANQLRYPNSHTHYFGFLILHLYLEAREEYIRNQITRVLLERLVALRPHPWGLLVTFIELTKNPKYDFWNHDFVRCAPEIERLFRCVANSYSAESKCCADGRTAHCAQQLRGAVAVSDARPR